MHASILAFFPVCIMVSPGKFNFSRKSITKLKIKAAKFLARKSESLYSHPKIFVEQPRPKQISKWTLPNFFFFLFTDSPKILKLHI